MVPMDETPDLGEAKETRNVFFKMEKAAISKANQERQAAEHLDCSHFLPSPYPTLALSWRTLCSNPLAITQPSYRVGADM